MAKTKMMAKKTHLVHQATLASDTRFGTCVVLPIPYIGSICGRVSQRYLPRLEFSFVSVAYEHMLILWPPIKARNAFSAI